MKMIHRSDSTARVVSRAFVTAVKGPAAKNVEYNVTRQGQVLGLVLVLPAFRPFAPCFILHTHAGYRLAKLQVLSELGACGASVICSAPSPLLSSTLGKNGKALAGTWSCQPLASTAIAGFTFSAGVVEC